MNARKSLFSYFSEAYDQYRSDRCDQSTGQATQNPGGARRILRWLMPNGGTLLIVLILILTQNVWAAGLQSPLATSTSTISYQGRLADSGGAPLTGFYNLEFRIYDVPTGGIPLWEELWTGGNAVEVSDGLFNVMLGSIANTLASSIEGHNELYLGITVGTDSEMAPRVQLGSVPFSMQAMTIPDDSVTTQKISDGAVTQAKAPFAPDAYMQFNPNGGDIKIMSVTRVDTLQGGTTSEEFTVDISSLGLTGKPHAICHLVNVGEAAEFCHVSLDGSTNTELHFFIRRYDQGNLGAHSFRVNIILLGR